MLRNVNSNLLKHILWNISRDSILNTRNIIWKTSTNIQRTLKAFDGASNLFTRCIKMTFFKRMLFKRAFEKCHKKQMGRNNSGRTKIIFKISRWKIRTIREVRKFIKDFWNTIRSLKTELTAGQILNRRIISCHLKVRAAIPPPTDELIVTMADLKNAEY